MALFAENAPAVLLAHLVGDAPLRQLHELGQRRMRSANIPALRFSIRLGAAMNKRIVKAYQDITITEVLEPDGDNTVNRAYLVRAAAEPKALQRFADLDAACIYFDVLVLRRLNRIVSRALRN